MYSVKRVIWCTLVSALLFTTSCTNIFQSKINKFNPINIIGISENGEYWLYQNDRFLEDSTTNNENASLFLWGNTNQKTLFKLSGIEYSNYLGKAFISSNRKKVYLSKDGRVIDFEGKISDFGKEFGLPGDIKKYSVLGEVNGILYLNTSENQIYAIGKGNTVKELLFLKDTYVYDVCEKGFYTVEVTGNKNEKTLLYLTDFTGSKKILIGDMRKADDRCISGVTILDSSLDGRFVAYSIGKTPTSLAVYDTISNTSKIFCAGDGVGDNDIVVRSFWTSNKDIKALLWNVNDKKRERVQIADYKVMD